MTHTRIIAADGTRFIPEGAARRRRNRIIATACGILATPFMVAAAVGIYLGATDQVDAPASPAVPPVITKALKACDEVPAQFKGYCTALYLRPAYNIDMGDSATYTPAGPALVKECTDQYTARDELGMCLTQGIAGDN